MVRFDRLAGFALLAIVAFAALWFGLGRSTDRVDQIGQKRILIASVVEIEPIAELREGFRERIANSALAGHVVFIERNAQGDGGLMAQIAGEVARQKPDLVYVLGTPLAQAIQKRAPAVVLVQGAVTDPVEAGLANGWNGSGRKYAANSDRPPAKQLVYLIHTLTPDVRSIGFLYNPSEPNSIAVLRDMKTEALRVGLTIKDVSVTRAADLPVALNAALSTTDALFIPPDNTVTAGVKGVIQSASVAKKPVFATTTEAVDEGALAGITTDFFTLGSEAAEIAISILVDGVNPANIPIALPKKTEILINPKTARELGVVPSSELQFHYVEG